MADAYTQIYIHVVFAVKGRENIIPGENKNELYKYITGIVTNQKQKLLAINIIGFPFSPASTNIPALRETFSFCTKFRTCRIQSDSQIDRYFPYFIFMPPFKVKKASKVFSIVHTIYGYKIEF